MKYSRLSKYKTPIMKNKTIQKLNEEYDFSKDEMSPEEIVEILKSLLNKRIVHFVYMRKDGTERDAYGTTNPDIINKRKQATGNGAGKNYNPLNVRYFDVDAGGWRMCKAENILRILDDTKEKPILTWETISKFNDYVDDLLDEDEGTYTVKQVVNGFLIQTDLLEDGIIPELTQYLMNNYEIDIYNNTLIGRKEITDDEISESIKLKKDMKHVNRNKIKAVRALSEGKMTYSQLKKLF